MTTARAEPLVIEVEGTGPVSGLLVTPPGARAGCVLAHGAGAGMQHPFMAALAAGLGERGVASLRYQFPAMERGARRPDVPAVAHATVRSAVRLAVQRLPGLPLVAGGKSFGGRMSSQAEALGGLPGVRGLVFFGFPLHPQGKPSETRAAHLQDVRLPMLFLQGTNDALAEWPRLQAVVARLGERATLVPLADADHAFHVPARSGRTDAEVRTAMLDACARWVDALA